MLVLTGAACVSSREAGFLSDSGAEPRSFRSSEDLEAGPPGAEEPTRPNPPPAHVSTFGDIISTASSNLQAPPGGLPGYSWVHHQL